MALADLGLTPLLTALTTGKTATAITAVGTGLSAAGTIAGGIAAKNAREYQAEQQELAAAEEMAAASRKAEQKRRQTQRLQSSLQAQSAADGFGALDETVLDLAGDIAQEGSVQSRTIRRGGQERATGLRAQAAASRMQGQADMTGSLFSAGGTIMGGMGSLADQYGMKKKTPQYSSRYG